MQTTSLVDARGQPIQKTETIDTSPVFSPSYVNGSQYQKSAYESLQAAFSVSPTESSLYGLEGARPNPRQYDYKLYLYMYDEHPIVAAAVNKKVEVAVNTGFDFIPRTRHMREVPEDQSRICTDFFGAQDNLSDVFKTVLYDLETIGFGFIYVVPDRRRRPKKLKRLAPWTVHIKAKDNGDVVEYIQKVGTKTKTFKPHEIIPFKHVSMRDDLYGQSPLESIKNTVAADLLAALFNYNFFENGAATGTVFAIKDASTAELELNRKWIREEYTGTSNAHKAIILAGDVQIHHSVASHQDMGFLEGRAANQKQILAAVNVPPAKLGDMETANRSNSKEQDKSFRTESIMPIQRIIEEGMSAFIKNILGCPDVWFKFSEGDVRDAQDQMDLWKTGASMGFVSINEVRSAQGRPKIEGGDIHYVMTPTGAVPVVDLELYFKLAQANFDQIDPNMRDKKPGADPAMYEIGPVPNSSDTNTAVVTGSPSAQKSLNLASAIGAVSKAVIDIHDDVALRHSIAYSLDAYEELQEHPILHEVVKALNKARAQEDEDLRLTYVERAYTYLSQMQGYL